MRCQLSIAQSSDVCKLCLTTLTVELLVLPTLHELDTLLVVYSAQDNQGRVC